MNIKHKQQCKKIQTEVSFATSSHISTTGGRTLISSYIRGLYTFAECHIHPAVCLSVTQHLNTNHWSDYLKIQSHRVSQKVDEIF